MMNKILTLAGLFFLSLPGLCATELELNKVRLPEAISLVYSDVLKVPFMLDPQLVNDERMVTFKITPDVDERAFITRYFQNMNIRIYTQKALIIYRRLRLRSRLSRARHGFIRQSIARCPTCRIS